MGLNAAVAALMEMTIELSGKTIIEFGDQLFDPGGFPARDWYLARGVVRYLSIDLNGDNGAIVRDIRSDLSDLGQFDIVTNLGTLEHLDNGIDGQKQGFAAMHGLCKVGGLVIQHIPVDMQRYRGHAPIVYSESFLETLYGANKYDRLSAFDCVIGGCMGRCYRKLSEEVFRFPWDAVMELDYFPGEGMSGRIAT